MAKTYVNGAVVIADKSYHYLTRYQQQLSTGATTAQLAALADLIACLAAFLQKWFKPPLNP